MNQTATTLNQRTFRSHEEYARYCQQMQREYIKQIHPFQRIMLNLLNVQPVRYTMNLDGSNFQRHVDWDFRAKEVYDQCQMQIDRIAESYRMLCGVFNGDEL